MCTVYSCRDLLSPVSPPSCPTKAEMVRLELSVRKAPRRRMLKRVPCFRMVVGGADWIQMTHYCIPFLAMWARKISADRAGSDRLVRGKGWC